MAASATLSRRRAVTWPAWLTAGCAIFAFAQTLGYYAYLTNDPGNYNGAGAFGDQVSYIALGQQVLHGQWQGASHYMPGLPALLALAQGLFGDPRLGIALLQGVFFAAMVIGAARLASGAFGATAGGWTAVLIALNPTIGYYASQALTEFLTGALLFLAAALLYRWSRTRRPGGVLWAGVCVALTGYLRSEYLAFAGVFAVVVLLVARERVGYAKALRPAALLLVTVLVAMAPWVMRYWIVTGRPAIYNESPISNLVLMGTWFRAFDTPTFARLQQIEKQPGTREDAVAAARQVGPNPDLSGRYMEQVRGPYELPLGQTLSMAVANIRLNTRQYLVSHFVFGPFLIWAGHTPLRQSDMARLSNVARYALWGAQLALLVLALWQAVASLRTPAVRTLSLAFIGVCVFLTGVHLLIAVDDRFTVPSLPLAMLFVAAWIGQTLPSLRRQQSIPAQPIA